MTQSTSNEIATLRDLGIVHTDKKGRIELDSDLRGRVFTVEYLENGNILLRPVYSQASVDDLPVPTALSSRQEAGKFYVAT